MLELVFVVLILRFSLFFVLASFVIFLILGCIGVSPKAPSSSDPLYPGGACFDLQIQIEVHPDLHFKGIKEFPHPAGEFLHSFGKGMIPEGVVLLAWVIPEQINHRKYPRRLERGRRPIICDSRNSQEPLWQEAWFLGNGQRDPSK